MGVYGSQLEKADWNALRVALDPFIHAKDPAAVPIPPVPAHLEHHQVMECIRKYRSSLDKQYLDQAGQLLVPTDRPFGWYVPLTK